MAERTIDRFYASYAEAVQVVADLTAIGVPQTAISLIGSETDPRLPPDAAGGARSPVAAGATFGAAICGGLGLLLGVGAVEIPDDLAPWFGAGWALPAAGLALVGAGAGAVIGRAVRSGSATSRGRVLARGLGRGQVLLTVRVESMLAHDIEALMARVHAVPGEATTTPALDAGPAPSLAEERAALYRAERTIQYSSQ